MVKIQLILGSIRQGRFGEQPAKWIFEELKKQEGVQAEFIDLRDWPLPFFDEPVSPAYNQGKYANELAAKWAKKVGEADGYIIVTPEYNHGYPAVLKNALDYVYNEWNNKPVAFVSYGGIAGGTRSVQQLRQVAIELQMVPVRAGIHIPFYWNQLDADGKLKTEGHEEGIKAMFGQLISFAKALKTLRK
ncbi:MAG TPA: NAD(P)H-dependent oxidoreductase [Candidatus Saccharimonadales bacterium]|nr:NAD(P)H-dependent oxidoreductase [Candidatus Saccharimonadales bacterium]